MNSKIVTRIVAALVLTAGTAALAQNWSSDKPDRLPDRLSGMINAYTPTTPAKAPVGPYEIRGKWSLKLNKEGTKADFSAAVNMILSDGWVITSSVPPTDPPTPPNFDPSIRNAHTHHITMNNADVTRLPNGGFQVIGTATVTINGGPTPFLQQSPDTTVIITGGTNPGNLPPSDIVEYSNFTLTMGAPASGHFGILPLPGVVQKVSMDKDNDR